MTFKVNNNQLDGIELLLRVLLNDNQPGNNAERLVYSHVSKVYAKIRAKHEMLYTAAKYSISLTDQEAWALHIFYSNVKVNDKSYPYEAITLQSIFNQIDQHYGKTNQTNYRSRGLAAGTSERRQIR